MSTSTSPPPPETPRETPSTSNRRQSERPEQANENREDGETASSIEKRIFTEAYVGELTVSSSDWEGLKVIADYLAEERYKNIKWTNKVTKKNLGTYIRETYGVTGYGAESLRLITISVQMKEYLESLGIKDLRMFSTKKMVNEELSKLRSWGGENPFFKSQFVAMWRTLTEDRGAAPISLAMLQRSAHERFGKWDGGFLLHQYLDANRPEAIIENFDIDGNEENPFRLDGTTSEDESSSSEDEGETNPEAAYETMVSIMNEFQKGVDRMSKVLGKRPRNN